MDTGVLTFARDYVIDVFMVGGGSSGAASGLNHSYQGAGGAGGFTKTYRELTVRKGNEYQIVIGAGGASIANQFSVGNNGGDTTAFGQTASGGKVSTYDYTRGASGGSGGGGGGSNPGAGGSDGSNGAGGYGGTGQGTTTREFGEETGKLYAGGGAGGTNTTSPILGGEGGGGNGAYATISGSKPAGDGQANTGGGGGGGTGTASGVNMSWHGANGGSGIVCIRLHKKSA